MGMRVRASQSGLADDVFEVGRSGYEVSERAGAFVNRTCVRGGASECKIRSQEGKAVCLDCFKDYD